MIVRMQERHKMEGGCCIWWMLYPMYSVLGMFGARSMLYSVYSLLGVNWWSWNGGIEWDDLTLGSAIMVELWMRKRDEGWRQKWYRRYERIWEIKGSRCLTVFRRPRIGVITLRICAHTCHIMDSKIKSHLKFSSVPFSHDVVPHQLSSLSFSSWTLPSPKYTELGLPSLSAHAMFMSYHRVQLTLSTASSQDQLSPNPSWYLISNLLADLVVINFLHSQNWQIHNKNSLSSHRVSLPIYHLQIQCIQVVLQSCSIMSSKCSSKLGWSWSQCASPNPFDHGLQVTACLPTS